MLTWFKQSNYYKHFLLGILFGILSISWYCTEYGALLSAGSLELKDKLYGNKWDWIDFGITIIGFNLGYFIRYIIEILVI